MKHVVFCLEKVKQEIKIMKGKRTTENRMGKMLSNVGKNAKEIVERSKDFAVQSVDQNDDGKFDLEDVSVMATTLGNAVRKGAHTLKETTNEKTRQRELKVLQPIFMEDLEGVNMPHFIRVTERDKKRAESEVCQGAIGYWSDYLKQVRISELQKIAQDLGAKHFRVTYKEEKSLFLEKTDTKKVGIKARDTAEYEQKKEEKKYSKIEIAAEMECPGHAPVEPELKYMKYDPTVKSLVELRMNTQGPMKRQFLTLKLSNSSGLKESEAVKIDAVLKGLKCSGNSTLISEAQNESKRYLEYEIDF